MAIKNVSDSITKSLDGAIRKMWEESEFSAFAVIKVVGGNVHHSLIIRDSEGTEIFREEFTGPISYKTPFEIALPVWPTFSKS